MDGVGGWGGGVVCVVRGEHPVLEEEEFVGELGEDVAGRGTMMEENHFRQAGEKVHGNGGMLVSGP